MRFLLFTLCFLSFNVLAEEQTDCKDLDQIQCRKRLVNILLEKKKTSPWLRNLFETVCKTNEPMACASLSSMDPGQKDKFTKDHFKALEKECKAKDVNACWGLAVAHGHGFTVPLSEKSALDLHTKACAEKQPLSCTAAGYLLQVAEKPDLARAIEFYQQGCELKDSQGCLYLGGVYQTEEKKDMTKAVENFRKSCELKHQEGCRVLGSVLFLNKDTAEESVKFLIKSCALGDGLGCKIMGLYYNEDRPEKSLDKGISYLDKGCLFGDGEACFLAGAMYEEGMSFNNEKIEKNHFKAVEYIVQSCHYDFLKACSYLSIRHNYRRPEYADLDFQEFTNKACLLGDERACARGGQEYKEKKLLEAAESECKNGSGDACYQIAQYFRHDRKITLTYLLEACEKNHPKACFEMGENHVNEALMNIDRKWNLGKAKEVFNRACKLKHPKACERAKQVK